MCHLILFMPLLALPVFWLLPLSVAAPIYFVVIAVSALIYWLIFKSMRKPIRTGREAMIHSIGVVEDASGDTLEVRIQGEHWTARCADEHLRPGDEIEVVSIEGLTLGVTRYSHQAR